MEPFRIRIEEVNDVISYFCLAIDNFVERELKNYSTDFHYGVRRLNFSESCLKILHLTFIFLGFLGNQYEETCQTVFLTIIVGFCSDTKRVQKV